MLRLNNIPWAPNQCYNQAEGCMSERGHPIEVISVATDNRKVGNKMQTVD